jgi:chromate reductase, NAD(P)H dehydrogenase (quinone)
MLNVTILSGTNRANSTTRQLVSSLEEIYASLGAIPVVVDLAQLPAGMCHPGMYEGEVRPAAFRPFIEAIEAADALVVCLPEYNGGMPGILKMFIDLLPDRDNILGGRPVAFVGIAAGQWGALRPIEQVAAVFTYRKSFIYPERVFIRDCEDMVDATGVLCLPDSLKRRLVEQAIRFSEFARVVSPIRSLFAAVPEPG